MRVTIILLLFFTESLLCLQSIQAQDNKRIYKIIIKDGHLIDAKNNINGVMDIAINDGKIALIAKDINKTLGWQIVNAKGLYVTPGLIDLHAHVFAGTEKGSNLSNGDGSLFPDAFSFRSGVTTMVDAGGAGWKSFDTFKKNIIDRSRTRVLSLLNIVGEGMKGDPWEQDTSDMDAIMTAKTALENKNDIVGFKLAHFADRSWTPVERILEAGKLADMPVMIDFGAGKLSLEDLLFKYLRSGDIYTHVFTELPIREPVVDLINRNLKPFLKPAQEKGIIFDVGFGAGSFNFNQAIPAFKAGFYPNTMGTDLHTGSMNGAMKDQLNVLSIFLAMGMDIPGVILRSTWAPALAINRKDLGNLSVGSVADIAILKIRRGTFGFKDIFGNSLKGKQKFECEMTIRGGAVVYDLNARAVNPSPNIR